MDRSPGVGREQLFTQLDNARATQLLPSGAFELINALRPDLLKNDKRTKTLGRLFSVELAVDDTRRRSVLLGAIPNTKAQELEDRTGYSIDFLKENTSLKSKTRRELLGFFGVSTLPQSSAGDITPDSEYISVSHGLFSFQKKVASELERYLYLETGRAMLHLPTGAGKTRTAMSIVASHLRNQSDGLVIWLAATRELLEQALEEFNETWSAVGDRPISCVRFWSHHDPSLEHFRDGIVFAGLAKLNFYGRKRERIWDLGDRTTMVVFDEAHQAVARTYRDVVETLITRNPKTPLLGLSATPGRTWGNPEADIAVAEMFHGNKVILDFGTVNPIKGLMDEGYLATVEFSLMNVEPGIKLTSTDLSEIANNLDIPSHIALRLGQDTQRNLRVLQRILELSKAHTRIIVFAPSVENARLIASVCRAVGLEAESITSETASIERSRIIARFKRSDATHRVLVNYGVLTTGFDAPAASAALIARPTKSLVLYSQMVGRIIRGPRAGGTERCEVITVVDTILPGFGDVAQAFLNWEDIWTQ